MTVGLVLLAIGMLWYTQLPVDGEFLSNLLPGYLHRRHRDPVRLHPGLDRRPGRHPGPQEAGLASGLINTSQQIGGAIGTAVASTIFITRIDDNLAAGMTPGEAFTDGYTLAFWGILVFAVLGVLATLVLVRKGELAPAHDDGVAEGAQAQA